jgi:hypothetical protein
VSEQLYRMQPTRMYQAWESRHLCQVPLADVLKVCIMASTAVLRFQVPHVLVRLATHPSHTGLTRVAACVLPCLELTAQRLFINSLPLSHDGFTHCRGLFNFSDYAGFAACLDSAWGFISTRGIAPIWVGAQSTLA